MSRSSHRVCPIFLAGSLDNRIRLWLQNPWKILGPYVRQGMTVLDLGCGPGFFSIPMAQMVGSAGHVVAADHQEGMLQKLKAKIRGTELEERVTLHKCEKNRIGISERVDFVLLFYVVHEVEDQQRFLSEVLQILDPNGRVLIVEPPLHVSNREFLKSLEEARIAGLSVIATPSIFLNKTALLTRSDQSAGA